MYLPSFANQLAQLVALAMQRHHDLAIADDLVQTAGQWLARRIEALGIRAAVTDDRVSSSDRYFFHDRLIQLRATTHFKADPVYWAIAAHELGHAQNALASPRLAWLRSIATRLRGELTLAAIGVGIGFALYGDPRMSSLALGLASAAVVCTGARVAEEASASWRAMRELRGIARSGSAGPRSGREAGAQVDAAELTPRHLRAVRAVLLAAWATYLAPWLVSIALLTQWHVFDRLVGDGYLAEPGALTGIGLGVAAVLSIIAVLAAIARVRLLVRPLDDAGRAPTIGLFAGTWFFVSAVFVYLAWDLETTRTWAWLVTLALVHAGSTAFLVLGLPFAAVSIVMSLLVGRLRPHVVDRTARYRDELQRGLANVEAGNKLVAALIKVPDPAAPWHLRLQHVLALLSVPLIVALWWP